jgi:hypothetical protein
MPDDVADRPSARGGSLLAAILGVVAVFAFVFAAVSSSLRWMAVVGAIALVACVALGFRSRNRPDVPIADE